MINLNDARVLAGCLDYYDSSGGSAPSEAADVIRGLVQELEAAKAELVQLRDWQGKAFDAHPNIDLDIEAICWPNV